MKRYLIFLLTVSNFCIAAAVNTKTGISGIIEGPHHISLPGAIVTIVNQQNQQKIQLETDIDGYFEAHDLKPGRYRIEVKQDNFMDRNQDNIQVTANKIINVPILLKLR